MHNGEISSYDANRRFIEMFGYRCTLLTDTEVITYIIDYLVRQQGLTMEEASNVMAAPFWTTIAQQSPQRRERLTFLRQAFSSLLLTGPFSILVGFDGGLMALNDRLKLRSMVVGEAGSRVYISSEERRHPGRPAGTGPGLGPQGRRGRHLYSKGGRVMSLMTAYASRFEVLRDTEKCISCGRCIQECAHGVHQFYKDTKKLTADEKRCVNCYRCVATCPTQALKIIQNRQAINASSNWSVNNRREIYLQAESGGVLLSGMGTVKNYPLYWDKLLINAAQVTNPSIDPLREPMETRTYLGRSAVEVQRDARGQLVNNLPTHLTLETPILFAAMSYGAISYPCHQALAQAATQLGIFYNTGEGGLHRDLYQYGPHTIVQVASGRFGVHRQYLETGAAVEIKIGQGAKPGIGGHLAGAKNIGDISKTRMIPEGTDAISPAPHHDIYSIEDLRQLVFSLKEATNYEKPILVKIAAVHNVAAIASGIARSGADIIVIDGLRAGTGAAPTQTRDNVGIPIELALAAVDSRLREEGIRNHVGLVASGTIRNSADIVKAIALGADAVAIGTAALIAMGCHMCHSCHTGNCSWGICTQRPELTRRLNPEEARDRLVNLITGWTHEIKEIMGGMGINSIETLRGNRMMLRGVGLTDAELRILGVQHAGE